MRERAPAAGAVPGAARLFMAAGLTHLALAGASSVLPEWGDIAVFRHWAVRVADSGVAAAYTSHTTPDLRYDWPPLYLYVSKNVGLAYQASGLRARFGPDSRVLALLLKLPMIACNLLVGWLLLRLAPRLHADARLARWTAAVWLWNPAIALATDVFGYQDALHTMLLVVAAGALIVGNGLWAPAGLALAALAKPQAWVFLVPFAAVFHRVTPRADRVRALALALLASLLVVLPFLLAGRTAELVQAHLAMPGLHPWPSALAHNVWWLLFPAGDEKSFPSDLRPVLLGLSPRWLAAVILAGYCGAVAARLGRRPTARGLVSLSALLAFAFFMLATQVHENHLYAMFPFLTLGAAGSRMLRGVLVATTLTFAANLGLALHWLAAGSAMPSVWAYLSLLNALVNVAILALWTRRMLLPAAEVGA